MGGLLYGNPFLFSVLPPLSRRNDFWGRSLRLLYGDGRSALSGGAPVGRFMGCALTFNYSLLSTHYSLIESFPFSVYFIGSICIATAVCAPYLLRRAFSISREISCESRTVIEPSTRICTSIAIFEPIRRVRKLCGL